MKQFVKALDKEGRCFKYLESDFTNVTIVKLKEGIPSLSRYIFNEP